MDKRWLVVVGGVSAVALFVSALPPCSTPLRAQAGCCKTRNALNAQWIKRADLAFAACRDFNQTRDSRDNVFEPSGLVWWDRACS
jgi:hypothetical protein